MAIIITNYSEKYRDDVRNICLDTAGSNAREEKSMRFLLATFCDYYIDREAEHCFIAVDEDTDSAVGYIFCAPDYQKYKRIFKAEYLPRVKGCKKGDIIESWASVNGPAIFARSYPAHMHALRHRHPPVRGSDRASQRDRLQGRYAGGRFI